MSFLRTFFVSLAFTIPAAFIGLAAGFHPDAVINGAAVAGGVFSIFNYRPS